MKTEGLIEWLVAVQNLTGGGGVSFRVDTFGSLIITASWQEGPACKQYAVVIPRERLSIESNRGIPMAMEDLYRTLTNTIAPDFTGYKEAVK